MKKRQRNDHSVFFRKAFAFAHAEAVVAYAHMGEHDSLGKSRGSRGVLHVDHVIGPYECLAGLILGLGNFSRPIQYGGKGKHSRMRNVLQAHDTAKMRKLFAVQLALVLILQVGNDPIQRRDVIIIEKAVDAEKIFAFRLPDEIFKLAVAIVGVHRKQRGSYAGGGKHERHPVGHVGGPQGNFFSGLHAQSHQAASQPVHSVGKLAPGLPVIVSHVNKGLTIGKTPRGFVQHLAEGAFLQFKF